ncbi:Major facilitator superfamily domain, general substrate transporter [Penicillium expansum]|uniref:Major facilitator superfamily domain, general substrate transporter n=1 Tax=Penicillium expansum TaxID=27334 RepID=A0A0A2JQ48_PENEN|nr:Major facilitator superfamily domain, general substrate transporter [Penicillium expansum]KGO54380.1 Major facilitator superfamily domain, general substrate transporter [Penicillium expansum]
MIIENFPINPAMELDTRVHKRTTAADHATSHESTTSLDRNKILLEADEFIAKYDLADSRNIIRKGVLLFYYLDDRSRIEEETIYLEDCKDMPTNNSPLTGMGICYAAGFLSLMVSRPCPEWGWVWLPPQPDGITRALHSKVSIVFALLGFGLSLLSNQYGGRRLAWRVGAHLALGASVETFISDNGISLFFLRGLSTTANIVLVSTSLLYIAETSAPSKRGSCMAKWYCLTPVIWGCFQVPGVLMMYIFGFSGAFLNLILSALAASTLLALSVTMLESPYWLACNGKIAEAYHSLRGFRQTELAAARDIYKIHNSINTRQTPFDGYMTGKKTVPKLDAFSRKRKVMTSLAICVVLMLTRGVSSIFVTEFFFRSFHGMEYFTRIAIYLCAAQQNVAAMFYIWSILLHFLAEVPVALYISEVFPLEYREMGVAVTVSVYAGCTAVLEKSMAEPSELGVNILGRSLLPEYYFLSPFYSPAS